MTELFLVVAGLAAGSALAWWAPGVLVLLFGLAAVGVLVLAVVTWWDLTHGGP